jgi:hypothetical protein
MVTVVLDALAAGLEPAEIVRHLPNPPGRRRPGSDRIRGVAGQAGDSAAFAEHVKVKLDENITVAAKEPLVHLGHTSTLS